MFASDLSLVETPNENVVGQCLYLDFVKVRAEDPVDVPPIPESQNL